MKTEDEKSLEKSLHRVISSEVDEISKDVIKQAQLEIEKRVRAKIGEITATILTRYDMAIRDGKMIITVDFKNTSK